MRAERALTVRDRHARTRGDLPDLSQLLARLERRIGTDARYSLQHVGPEDWSVITIDGDAGHGDSPAAAVDDLLRWI